jgi:hypothetical protein
LLSGVSRLNNISTVHAGGLVKYLSRRATRQTLSGGLEALTGKEMRDAGNAKGLA